MSDSAGFATHRRELLPSLLRGEAALSQVMTQSLTLMSGHTLIEADTQHEFVYRLRSGWACRTRHSNDGRGQIILVFLPGDLFAVKSMFLTLHPDRVVTLSRCVVDKIHQRELHEVFKCNSDVAQRCIWQVIEEERRLHSWVFGLGQGSAEERLALLLADFRGRLIISRTIPAEAISFVMPLNQTQLADHLGITPVHVNRVLRVFRERGLVTVRGREVTIHSLSELKSIAEPLLDEYERHSAVYWHQSQASHERV